MTEKLNKKNRPHALLVYTGGHGVTANGDQMYLLDSNNHDEATFDIETKLKSLTKADSSLLKVFAMYDCDRFNLSKIKGLKSLLDQNVPPSNTK